MYPYPFTPLNNDSYAPSSDKIKLSLQQWIDGGHYSFACIDTTNRTIRNDFNYDYSYYYSFPSLRPVFIGTDLQNYPISFSEKLKLNKWLAWQTYHTRSIPVNLRNIVETYSDIGDVETVYDKDFDEYYFKTTEEHFKGDITRKITKPSGAIINERLKNGVWVSTAIVSNSDILLFSNWEIYERWLTPVIGYESVWNSSILTSLSATEQNNIVGGGANTNYSASTFNNSSWKANISEKILGRIGSNWWRVSINGLRKFNIGGDIHEVKFTGFNNDWTLYRTVYDAPCYLDLVRGYFLDDRQIPQTITLKSLINKSIRLGYYRRNPFEEVKEKKQELTSIDWIDYQIELTANKDTTIEVDDLVLGTLWINNNDLEVTSSYVGNNFYPVKYLKYSESATADLFTHWRELHDAEILRIQTNYPHCMPRTPNGQTHQNSGKLLRILAANNDRYANGIAALDLQLDNNHPLFKIDNQRTYDYFFKPQTDGSFGDLTMDSWRTIETRDAVEKLMKALEAEKYSTNELNPDEPRVATLAWHINRQSEISGIRVKADGKIDEEAEKTVNLRLHADGSEDNNPQEYGINSFGSKGMLVRHLPNKFSPSGTVAGGYRKVKDLPQLLAEFHEQANAAVGYQEGTAIEIQLDGETYRYPNQLALLIELFVTAKQTATYSKGAFFSSVVGEQSIKEVMSGLGLRTVDKFIEFEVAGKVAKLYYKGISASQSIRRKLSAVATNIGITIGNII
jgi:hypothetical protein